MGTVIDSVIYMHRIFAALGLRKTRLKINSWGTVIVKGETSHCIITIFITLKICLFSIFPFLVSEIIMFIFDIEVSSCIQNFEFTEILLFLLSYV